MLCLPGLFPCTWLELLIARLSKISPGCRYFWWGTGRVRRIELLADLGEERAGFCLCLRRVPQPRNWLALQRAWQRGLIQRGFVMYNGRHAFNVNRVVQVMPYFQVDALTLPLKYCRVPDSGTYSW
jgi:hypothetical protein